MNVLYRLVTFDTSIKESVVCDVCRFIAKKSQNINMISNWCQKITETIDNVNTVKQKYKRIEDIRYSKKASCIKSIGIAPLVYRYKNYRTAIWATEDL